jgi:hypothetical protein
MDFWQTALTVTLPNIAVVLIAAVGFRIHLENRLTKLETRMEHLWKNQKGI